MKITMNMSNSVYVIKGDSYMFEIMNRNAQHAIIEK
jgi:hypothetical protein